MKRFLESRRGRPLGRLLSLAISCIMAVLLLTSCRGGKTIPAYAVAMGGNPDRGAAIIREVGCGTCHTIPGIKGARGRVAAPLNFFAERSYIAGQLPNRPENLTRWLLNPPAVEPGTAMPNVGLTDEQARDVAAYLYTLR